LYIRGFRSDDSFSKWHEMIVRQHKGRPTDTCAFFQIGNLQSLASCSWRGWCSSS
jgi:hypothetical protein